MGTVIALVTTTADYAKNPKMGITISRTGQSDTVPEMKPRHTHHRRLCCMPDVMTIADEADSQLTQAMDGYVSFELKAVAA